MNRIFNLILLMAVVVVGTAFINKRADKYTLDVQKSKISWQADKIVGSGHKGEIPFTSGSLLVEKEALVGGDFVANVDGLKITGESNPGRLEGHLKNEDFFETNKYPTATFKITKVAYSSKDKATVTGDLTIKGITNAISFPATIHSSAQQIHAVAEGIKIDRTKFNVKYRSGSFFSDLGDKAIKDEFTLDIELVAKK
ncbi:YceI family protein [Olivibacter sitiensis]|uniref:YceI family protein n=1 Tax=Olivibacter sitiensis TaxID=376470 RepID=UPI00048367E3|nr:YceI family protein [Olivibacter sitiensis]